ncbi:hypothetical protein SAMN02745687_01128 [Lachnospiraceae bacterium NK3A20]|nr:hypothetical protein SAMN02745687_01128 [Lachnospiraceae bacterium NK3A20]
MMRNTLVDNTTDQNKIIHCGETLYLLSFLALLFAKAVGMDDGMPAYNALLIAGALFFALKLIISRNTMAEWLMVVLILAISGAVYRNTGIKGLLLYSVMMLGVRNADVRKIFRWGAVVWTASFTVTILLAQTGLRTEIAYDHPKHFFDYVICHALGYTHPNVTQISFVVLLAFLLYLADDHLSRRQLLVVSFLLMAGNLWLFLNTMSYTGAAMATIYLILNYCLTGERSPGKREILLVRLILPLSLIFSIVGPIVLKTPIIYERIPIVYNRINDILNTRYDLSRYFLLNEPITLFGSRLVVPNYRYTMDCSYVYLLVQCGVIPFLFVISGLFLLIHDYTKRGLYKETALILGFCIAGISEPFLFNTAFKNLIFIFLGEYLYRKTAEWRQHHAAAPGSRWNHVIEVPALTRTVVRIFEESGVTRAVRKAAGPVLSALRALLRTLRRRLGIYALIAVLMFVLGSAGFHAVGRFPADILLPAGRNMDNSLQVRVYTRAEMDELKETSRILENDTPGTELVAVSASTRAFEYRVMTVNAGVWTAGAVVCAIAIVETVRYRRSKAVRTHKRQRKCKRE